MRFILGLLIGVGIGFAASVLLSPGKGETIAVRGTDDRANGATGGSTFGGLRKQFDEAMGEAKKAQREAEEKMNERYRQIVGRSDK